MPAEIKTHHWKNVQPWTLPIQKIHIFISNQNKVLFLHTLTLDQAGKKYVNHKTYDILFVGVKLRFAALCDCIPSPKRCLPSATHSATHQSNKNFASEERRRFQRPQDINNSSDYITINTSQAGQKVTPGQLNSEGKHVAGGKRLFCFDWISNE